MNSLKPDNKQSKIYLSIAPIKPNKYQRKQSQQYPYNLRSLKKLIQQFKKSECHENLSNGKNNNFISEKFNNGNNNNDNSNGNNNIS